MLSNTKINVRGLYTTDDVLRNTRSCDREEGKGAELETTR